MARRMAPRRRHLPPIPAGNLKAANSMAENVVAAITAAATSIPEAQRSADARAKQRGKKSGAALNAPRRRWAFPKMRVLLPATG
jgi:hypothetical protein